MRKQKRYNESLACYDTAINLNPNDAVFFCNKGTSLHNLEKYEEAIICFNKAIELNPDYSIAFNNRATSMLKINQANCKALESYDKEWI